GSSPSALRSTATQATPVAPTATQGALTHGAGTPDTATYDASTRTLLWRVLEGTFKVVNHFVPWHELPPWIGIFNLAALRNQLRRENLHDTSKHTADATANVPPFE